MLAKQNCDTQDQQSELTLAFELDWHFASLYTSSVYVQEHACCLANQLMQTAYMGARLQQYSLLWRLTTDCNVCCFAAKQASAAHK